MRRLAEWCHAKARRREEKTGFLRAEAQKRGEEEKKT
jgi:hypothetical protein